MSGVRSRPTRRPLKVFALDPSLGRAPGNRMVLTVPNEPLKPGTVGLRLNDVDYDGESNCYYEPVNLYDPSILMQCGLEPMESNPQFHQQMVYAVGMRVIENFERALGRRFTFGKGKPLRLMPHAFLGANAYYDAKLHAILF